MSHPIPANLDPATLRAIADECSERADRLSRISHMTAIAAISREARRVTLVELATELRQRALQAELTRRGGQVTR